VVKTGVTLYVIGGQRVVLTPEEAAKFRPVPSLRKYGCDSKSKR
jgi:hypothetical protein